MKSNILKIAAVAFGSALSLSAAAQNLDPTVVVNRAYEGKLLEVHKPSFEMAVPDSVRHFDLDFDYSVFENPYKGSYEFKPYQLMMQPMSSEMEYTEFYFKAGAGYSFYPQAELVWTPRLKGKFKMNVYGDYDGYVGGYRSFKPDYVNGKTLYLNRWKSRNHTSSTWKGYRMRTRAGIDGRVDWKKGMVAFDLAYLGIASKDTLKNRAYDSFDLNVNVASKPSGDNYFKYNVNAGYRFGKDKLEYGFDYGHVSEHIFDLDASLGPVIDGSHKMLFDVGMQTVVYSGGLKGSATELYLTPHYVFARNKWLLDLGVRVAKVMRPDETDLFGFKDQIVYPAVNVRYSAIRNAMNVYGKIGGGNVMNTYSSLIEKNPFVDPTFAMGTALLDTGVERISVVVGADGRISRRFSYDVSVGYANYGNALLDAVVLSSASGTGYAYVPAYGYSSYSKIFASAEWMWHTDRIDFDGSVCYSYITGMTAEAHVFKPAALTGNVAFVYNWNKRIFAGVDCNFSTNRKGYVTSTDAGMSATFEPVQAVMPGFADLGICAEYAASRALSFWMRGGNLLNSTIQYSPLYAEKGINFTAGVCLKF